NLTDDLAPSSRDHPLGTDKLGRDVLSRIVYGSRISLAVGATTVAVSLAIGLWIGALCGYLGGRTDRLLMRLVDILMAFPGILVAPHLRAAPGIALTITVLALKLAGGGLRDRLEKRGK